MLLSYSPAPAGGFFSIKEIDCIHRLAMESSLGVALTTLRTNDCDRTLGFQSPCVTTVYLECRKPQIINVNKDMLLLPLLSLHLQRMHQ